MYLLSLITVSTNYDTDIFVFACMIDSTCDPDVNIEK